MMMTKAGWIIGVLATTALTFTSAHAEVETLLRVHDCVVMISLGSTEAETFPQAMCVTRGETGGFATLSVACHNGGNMVAWTAGGYLPRSRQDVSAGFVFDNEEPISGSYSAENGIVTVKDESLYDTIMPKMATANAVIVGVKEDFARISLRGSAKVLAEYKRQCTALGRGSK